jgi:16S rRNA (adenine1518-N6/adenine1519-N6)-dimethyltransferase
MKDASGTEKRHPAAKRSLGQHFLRDPNIARKIVGLLRITAEDSVLEIGPGPGALTRFIADRNPARLLVVEKDVYWAEAMARLLAEYGPVSPSAAEEESPRAAEVMFAGRPRVLQADAQTLPFERFTPGWKIIGNLPYNIASPLLWELFSRMPAPAKAVFMLQKEVGLRLTAAPGSRAYGALSVWLQSFTRPRAAFVVPPHVFHPRPKVDSMVLVFEPLTSCLGGNGDRTADGTPCSSVPLTPCLGGNDDRQCLSAPIDRFLAPADVSRVPASPPRTSADPAHAPMEPARAPMEPARASMHLPCSPAELAGVLHACFRMRRKQMGSIATACGIAPHRLEALGINLRSRPENLTPEEFQRLAAARLFI